MSFCFCSLAIKLEDSIWQGRVPQGTMGQHDKMGHIKCYKFYHIDQYLLLLTAVMAGNMALFSKKASKYMVFC